MGKEGGPSGDEGSGDGLAQGVLALAGSGFGGPPLQLQKRPSGSDLDRQILGMSVLKTFAHPVVPCLRIVLCVAGVQLFW